MSTKIDDWLLEILACPQSQAPRVTIPRQTIGLRRKWTGLPGRDGIPVLLVDEARKIG